MGLGRFIKKVSEDPGSPISSVANVNQQSALAPAQTTTPTSTPTAASLTPGYSALATPEKFLSALEQVGAGSQTDRARSLGDYIINYTTQTGEKLFPEGRFQEIRATSPTQRDYNIAATEDLVRNLPGGLAKDIIAPGLAGIMSLPYDAIQAYSRMKPESGIKGFYDAFMAENPFSSMVERFTGAAGPLAERISGTTPTTSISPYQEGSQAFGDQLLKEQSGIDVPYSPFIYEDNGVKLTPEVDSFLFPSGETGYNLTYRNPEGYIVHQKTIGGEEARNLENYKVQGENPDGSFYTKYQFKDGGIASLL